LLFVSVFYFYFAVVAEVYQLLEHLPSSFEAVGQELLLLLVLVIVAVFGPKNTHNKF